MKKTIKEETPEKAQEMYKYALRADDNTCYAFCLILLSNKYFVLLVNGTVFTNTVL